MRLSAFGGPWGIAGGWAIDLFLGFESRLHADVDVAILRRDQQLLRVRLADAHANKVIAHQLTPWRSDEVLASPIHEVHATWPDGAALEFLLNDDDPTAQEWVYRRDARVRRSLRASFRRSRDISYLAPEIVLLYKSKAASPKDVADFESARPLLTSEQRAWLRQALIVSAPGHPWADILMQER
jgi:hypothetical protein